MSLPATDDLRELLEWEPAHGVLSVYLHVDHADRGGGWRIALRDTLRDAVNGAGDAEPAVELKATAERVLGRFGEETAPPPDGRGQILFTEIGREPGRERHFTTMAVPRLDAVAVAGPRPHLQPLVELLDDHRSRGVVAVNGERARILEWKEGELTELAEREILTTGDWRERKAPRNRDIPSGQAPTSSGRDQHEQRLDDHRRRFVDEIASEVGRAAGSRNWDELLCFGEAKHLAELQGGLNDNLTLHSEEKNLLSIPDHELAERLAELTGSLNRKREIALIEAAGERARAGGRGSLGLTETAQALAEGRVEHLVLAGAELPAEPPTELVEALAREGQASSLPTGELLIERALQTDAKITPVEGEAAEQLAEHGAAAAVLRY